jgi:hypothetical protein
MASELKRSSKSVDAVESSFVTEWPPMKGSGTKLFSLRWSELVNFHSDCSRSTMAPIWSTLKKSLTKKFFSAIELKIVRFFLFLNFQMEKNSPS